jgi:hypothetical protein
LLQVDRLILFLSNQPQVAVDGLFTGVQAGNRLFIEGPNYPRSRVMCGPKSFYECFINTWIRYEHITTLRLRSVENGGTGKGENSSFSVVLGLLVELATAHPRAIRRLEYRPRLAMNFESISTLIGIWKSSLLDLCVNDGGTMMHLWEELLMDTRLESFGVDISPHLVPGDSADLNSSAIDAICRQSNKPIQALKVTFCDCEHHVSHKNFIGFGEILYNLRSVPVFRLDLPSYDGRSLFGSSDWIHSVVSLLAYRDPKSPFQLGLRQLGLSAGGDPSRFLDVLLLAFPNLLTIIGTRCCKSLAQEVMFLAEFLFLYVNP